MSIYSELCLHVPVQVGRHSILKLTYQTQASTTTLKCDTTLRGTCSENQKDQIDAAEPTCVIGNYDLSKDPLLTSLDGGSTKRGLTKQNSLARSVPSPAIVSHRGRFSTFRANSLRMADDNLGIIISKRLRPYLWRVGGRETKLTNSEWGGGGMVEFTRTTVRTQETWYEVRIRNIQPHSQWCYFFHNYLAVVALCFKSNITTPPPPHTRCSSWYHLLWMTACSKLMLFSWVVTTGFLSSDGP